MKEDSLMKTNDNADGNAKSAEVKDNVMHVAIKKVKMNSFNVWK